MKDLRFAYDYVLDEFSVAINCFGICGDADGDGDPSRTSPELSDNGGTDSPNFAQSEACAFALDVGNPAINSAEPDGTFEFIMGYPSDNKEPANRFPCGTAFDQTCFGLYSVIPDPTLTDHLGNRFRYDANTAATFSFAKDRNPNLSAVRPDIEWSIERFNALRSAVGVPPVDTTGVVPFSMNVRAFCGSFNDDGVGEDTFPNSAVFQRVDWPCFVFDACDVCGGDGSTCRDCAGVPNGNAVYDECDICNGSGGRDCLGVPCGTTVVDVCNVCGGDGTSCLDCAGTPFGTRVYDQCDVCLETDDPNFNASCRDCAGVANGPLVYDVCNVCGGDGQSCLDCAGVPFGTSTYDICGDCNGDGSRCLRDPEPRNPCAPKDPNVCTLEAGDTFSLTLNSEDSDAYASLLGEDATFCVAELGYTALSGEKGTVFSRWSLQQDGAFIVDDFVSAPDNTEACRTGNAGRYILNWNSDCSEAVIDAAIDNCNRRRSALRNVVLKRHGCRNAKNPVYEVSEGTVWTGLNADGDRSWLNFCANKAYIETVKITNLFIILKF